MKYVRVTMLRKQPFDKTFITFLIVGVVNTLFGTIIMFVLYNAFGCSYWVSSFCDYFFGSILSYFLNKHFTFHYQGTDWRSIVKFALNIIVCYLIAYSLALPLTRAALESMHWSKTVVENVAMIVLWSSTTLARSSSRSNAKRQSISAMWYRGRRFTSV